MLTLCFTYFQVMPEFVSFLLLFGFRAYAQDFYFSGFRQRTRLAEHRQNSAPNARPVEKRIQSSYNFKSVELSDSGEWSTRHCAVHHSFNMMEGRTKWIIFKGNDLMKRRIDSATSDRRVWDTSVFKSRDRAFETSLETHPIFCDWSAENWRRYINSLEDRFQDMTRRIFSAPIHMPFSPTTSMDQFRPKSRTHTARTDRSKLSVLSWALTQMTEKGSFKPAVKHQTSDLQTYTNPDTEIT